MTSDLSKDANVAQSDSNESDVRSHAEQASTGAGAPAAGGPAVPAVPVVPAVEEAAEGAANVDAVSAGAVKTADEAASAVAADTAEAADGEPADEPAACASKPQDGAAPAAAEAQKADAAEESAAKSSAKAAEVKKPAAKKAGAKSSTKKSSKKSQNKKSAGKSSVSKAKAAAATTDAAGADGAASAAASLASRQFGLPVLIVVAVVVAILAGLLGSCIAGAGHGTSPKLTDAQLDQPVASYTYKGSKHDVTARQAIESQYGVDQMKDADGNYSAPSTETILRYVRNLIICEDAKAQGINPSDEELLAYAKDTLNTDNFETVAQMYGVSEDQAKEIVRVTCTVNKLNEQVSNAGPKAPEAPNEPKKGDEDKANADYGKYIAQLLGDAWDAEKDDWATTEGYLHELLANQEISTKQATYNQANAVYQAAFQNYSVNVAAERQSWGDYVNNLFKDASIDVYGLYL